MLNPPLPLARGLMRVSLGLAAAGLLASCASHPLPADYAQEQPRLDVRSYFNGPLTAHGLFTDRAGKVVKRFTVQLQGHWDGPHGVLEEDFVYSDGTRQRRVWRLTDLGGGRWQGQADDVVGIAQGQAAGNALNWRYTLRLPVNGSVYEVSMDDWMYQMDTKVLLNKTAMSKLGVRLGEVTLAFRKP